MTLHVFGSPVSLFTSSKLNSNQSTSRIVFLELSLPIQSGQSIQFDYVFFADPFKFSLKNETCAPHNRMWSSENAGTFRHIATQIMIIEMIARVQYICIIFPMWCEWCMLFYRNLCVSCRHAFGFYVSFSVSLIHSEAPAIPIHFSFIFIFVWCIGRI